MNPHLRIHRNAAPHAGQWFVALALGAACSIGPGQLLQSDGYLPQGPKYTQRVVMLFVWKSGTPMRVANWWDMFFVFLFRAPIHAINGVWKLGTPPRWTLQWRNWGCFYTKHVVILGMVYGSLWRGLPGSVQSVYMFQQGPPSPFRRTQWERQSGYKPASPEANAEKKQPWEFKPAFSCGEAFQLNFVWLLVVFDAWHRLMWERIFQNVGSIIS